MVWFWLGSDMRESYQQWNWNWTISQPVTKHHINHINSRFRFPFLNGHSQLDQFSKVFNSALFLFIICYIIIVLLLVRVQKPPTMLMICMCKSSSGLIIPLTHTVICVDAILNALVDRHKRLALRLNIYEVKIHFSMNLELFFFLFYWTIVWFKRRFCFQAVR